MKYVYSITAAAVLAATAAVTLPAMEAAAQPLRVDTGPTGAPNSLAFADTQGDRIAELEAQVAALEKRVETRTTQRDNARRRKANVLERLAAAEARVAELEPVPEPEALTLAQQDQRWFDAYAIAGGRNAEIFRNVILPCESGTALGAHDAIGPTDDWGRAQINRKYWSARFEEITGLTFDPFILDPALNGMMAATVEQEHFSGLNAWACFR